MSKINKISRTFLPEIIAPGTGLSPITDKSVIPTNNVFTIQDALNGQAYRIPGGGGSWGVGEDEAKTYKEDGDDYKRQERDLDLIKNIYNQQVPQEEWSLRVPGGAKNFQSFEEMLLYRKKLINNGVNVKWMTRVKTAQANNTNAIVQKVLSSTFKVESIDLNKGVMEVGECFCVRENIFMTCAHVIQKYNKNTERELDVNKISQSKRINIISQNNRYEAKLISINALEDMAILQAEIKCQPIPLQKTYAIGQEIFAIGSPHGFENNVSFGNVGSVNRKIYKYEGAPSYIFLDLAVFHGNSGGPVIDSKSGGIIAMVTAIVSTEGEYGLNAGIGVDYLEKYLNSYKKGDLL